MGIVNRENKPIEVSQLLETQELHLLDDKSVCLFIHIPFQKNIGNTGIYSVWKKMILCI